MGKQKTPPVIIIWTAGFCDWYISSCRICYRPLVFAKITNFL